MSIERTWITKDGREMRREMTTVADLLQVGTKGQLLLEMPGFLSRLVRQKVNGPCEGQRVAQRVAQSHER
jgi:hypothetical protein